VEYRKRLENTHPHLLLALNGASETQKVRSLVPFSVKSILTVLNLYLGNMSSLIGSGTLQFQNFASPSVLTSFNWMQSLLFSLGQT
jgi:hypothetical protein